jgi:hypothetical protein
MKFYFYPVQKSCIYQITSAMGKIPSKQEWVLKSVPMNQHKCVAILGVYLWRNAYWVFIFWRWSLITVYSRNMQKSYMYWRSLYVRNVLYVCEMSSSISCKVSNGVSSCSFWTVIQQLRKTLFLSNLTLPPEWGTFPSAPAVKPVEILVVFTLLNLWSRESFLISQS